MTTILHRTGDVDSITYGGGVVIEEDQGIMWYFWDELEEDGNEVTTERPVWGCLVEDDILDWHNWVTAEELSSFTGQEVGEIVRCSTGTVVERVSVLENIRDLWGADNLDQAPVSMKSRELTEFAGFEDEDELMVGDNIFDRRGNHVGRYLGTVRGTDAIWWVESSENTFEEAYAEFYEKFGS
ncbi:MAG: hypothetical protein ACYTFG_00110 [Planctomycetota bacterium]|jgi:hypothetical protein